MFSWYEGVPKDYVFDFDAEIERYTIQVGNR